jgi:hypothetical protein
LAHAFNTVRDLPFPYALSLSSLIVTRAMDQATSFSHVRSPNPLHNEELCLLSLDGGGVRGLSTLYVLKIIMDRLNYEREKNNLTPVKPCEVFDLIGGTSTGG